MGTEEQPAGGQLPRLQLDQLLEELQNRIEEARGTRDRVHSLLQAVMSVGRGLQLPQVLRQIVQAATVLVDAEYGALGVVGEGQQLTQFLPVGLSEELIGAIGSPPCGRGILGELIQHPEPLRLTEISEHPASYGFPAHHPPMHSFLGVPVRVGDEVFGNLYLTEKRSAKEFDAEDESVLTTLAVAAGVAIENARLYEESRYRQRWLEANADIVAGLLSGADAPRGLLRGGRGGGRRADHLHGHRERRTQRGGPLALGRDGARRRSVHEDERRGARGAAARPGGATGRVQRGGDGPAAVLRRAGGDRAAALRAAAYRGAACGVRGPGPDRQGSARPCHPAAVRLGNDLAEHAAVRP